MKVKERLPQRFRWKDQLSESWQYGVIMPGPRLWFIRCGVGHGSFRDDPWEILGTILGDAYAFEWIDNEHGWHGELFDWERYEASIN